MPDGAATADIVAGPAPAWRTASLVRRYRVDDTHALSLIRQSVQDGGSVHVNWALPAPAIELVVITPLHG